MFLPILLVDSLCLLFFFYCSSSCVFVGACFLGGLYFKWFLVIISNNGLYSLFIPKDRFLSDSICI